MPQKKTTLKEAVEFAEENGYMFAMYQKKDNQYHLVDKSAKAQQLAEETDLEIIVETIGSATDFNEFTSVDEQVYFLLHNNYNVPEIITLASNL